jgi:hypothetical protein
MPNILHDANDRVSITACTEYGDPTVNLHRIAVGWTEILGRKVTAEEVALCMIWLKVSRLAHAYKRDSVVDIAGYARCLEIVAETPR